MTNTSDMEHLMTVSARFNSLYKHQQDILKEDKKKAGLFLGTGSGKTRIALLLARGETLVICPKTQKEDQNWEREAEKLQLTEAHVTVISKEQFKKLAPTLPRFNTVIIDEAHTALGVTPNIRFRNKKAIPKASQLFEALADYLKKYPPERLYLVTATIIRSPMTVWAVAYLFGKDFDFYNWRQTFYMKLPMPGREVYVPKSDSDTKNKLAKVVRAFGYVGRLSDYFDVPDQSYRVIHVELTAAQRTRIKELSLEYPDPIVLLGKKHQVENGILAGDEFKAPETFKNEKIDKLLELSLEFPRMVIFAKYTAQIEQIAIAFEDTDKRVFILQGGTKDRGALIKEANECGCAVFIVQAQISAGWELGKTPEHPEYFDYNVMVFASMDYSVVNRIQGEGRILRSNNLKKNLYIDLVVRGGVDSAVHEAIINKQDFNERIYLNL